MKVVILRHATRSVHGLGDSALNETGRQQAEDLARLLTSQAALPIPFRLYASPKRRAKETLEPISLTFDVTLTIDARLDERKHGESLHDFEGRILEFVEEISDLEPALAPLAKPGEEPSVYVCSHLDWLESAMTLLPSDMSELETAASWSNCEYRIFEAFEGIWSLKGRGHVPARG